MKFCISTVSFSIIVNGSPIGFSRARRSLRQGDPLSPFLFLLAREGLNSMVKTTNMNGWLRGFNVATEGRDNLEVTHLQYADDSLIFYDADEEQIKVMRVILDCTSTGERTFYILSMRSQPWNP